MATPISEQTIFRFKCGLSLMSESDRMLNGWEKYLQSMYITQSFYFFKWWKCTFQKHKKTLNVKKYATSSHLLMI